MWEFSLACNNKNKHILEYINNCFCGDLPDCILTTFADKHFTYLLFASDDSISKICKSKIKKCISTYIIDVYKYEYFTKKILKNQTLINQAYIKALTLYDVDTDMALIDSMLELNIQFYIDSFIHFKLKDLERMWQELCELITSNINYLNRDMMIDVMRQFIATFDSSVTTLKIIIEKDGFVLYRIENNKQPVKLKDKAPAIDIVNYAMLTNPKNIEIYGNINDNFSMISLLKSLYDDKVNVIH
ncbi:MAG: hypothetical protein IJ458_02685 [Clostridia bacterium]|nr:hypothetical protein [Clostridia bacterium]